MTVEFIVSFHDPKNVRSTGERIVRCKDCRYLHRSDYYWCELTSTARVKYPVKLNGFCSEGKEPEQ